MIARPLRSRRTGVTLIEGLVAGMLFLTLLAVLWPVVRTLLRAEEQLASFTGPTALLASLRERLAWDFALACPAELAGRSGSGVLEDGSGVDVLVADRSAPGGVRAVAWRFDASRNVVTRNGLVVPLDGLTWAYFGLQPDRPGALELHVRGAGAKGGAARLVFHLRPASQGLDGWKTARAARS